MCLNACEGEICESVSVHVCFSYSSVRKRKSACLQSSGFNTCALYSRCSISLTEELKVQFYNAFLGSCMTVMTVEFFFFTFEGQHLSEVTIRSINNLFPCVFAIVLQW